MAFRENPVYACLRPGEGLPRNRFVSGTEPGPPGVTRGAPLSDAPRALSAVSCVARRRITRAQRGHVVHQEKKKKRAKTRLRLHGTPRNGHRARRRRSTFLRTGR